MSLSPTLETYLADRGTRYTLEHHAASLSSLETARAARIDEDSLAKSVVLVDGGGHLLAVMPASRRLELSEVRARLGRTLRLAREEEIVELFPDCALGAIPALGAAFGLPTVVDTSLEECDEIFFEAGDHETLVHMTRRDFLALQEDAERVRIATRLIALNAARGSRLQLYESILAVSEALAAPAGDALRWRRCLLHELAELREGLEGHVRETEGPEGLIEEIVGEAPRLAREVEELRREHVSLRALCARTLARAQESESPGTTRQVVLRLLGELAHHRHRGADLVYEAFGVDIGGG
jgi:Ala-tRNA(Pro) deacylase